ncbi:AAA family ATPase [Candidatus Parvarchaeota archaeon]|uniref:AAA family ATPase n=1 Tax=Candidatus Acidifodinimicrobium mancum TaxID=2898728 RepID=A0A8T3USM9_9ARCH|nr:AAA family ATPase [Candidatus Acidifodinimicrobium mancum]MBE5729743.1 AAA family ATPase [Candidatus Acidifodinimicrobium mancum]
MVVERIKTGIYGLDEKIEGGFEKGSVITVLGGPGAGKSIIGMQFLHHGAKNGENGLYYSFEESRDDIIKDMEVIGLDPKDLIKQNKLSVVSASPVDFEYLPIIDSIKKDNIRRLVIDSLSTIYMYFENNSKFRRFLLDLVNSLKEIGVTTIMTDEQSQGTGENEIMFFSGEYLSDAVIKLYYSGLGGEYDRSMQIIKMRRTNNERSVIPMKIGQGGVYLR